MIIRIDLSALVSRNRHYYYYTNSYQQIFALFIKHFSCSIICILSYNLFFCRFFEYITSKLFKIFF